MTLVINNILVIIVSNITLTLSENEMYVASFILNLHLFKQTIDIKVIASVTRQFKFFSLITYLKPFKNIHEKMLKDVDTIPVS